MKLTIAIADNNLIISHNGNQKFKFDLDDIVDLNEFIKTISESEEKIECEPKSFISFCESDENSTDDMLKLVEYVFKIINAFNESYSETYEE
jgi:hypothetical protein